MRARPELRCGRAWIRYPDCTIRDLRRQRLRAFLPQPEWQKGADGCCHCFSGSTESQDLIVILLLSLGVIHIRSVDLSSAAPTRCRCPLVNPNPPSRRRLKPGPRRLFHAAAFDAAGKVGYS